MRHTTVATDNVQRFRYALQAVMNRTPGTEGMVVLWGRPGEGKTTVITDAAQRFNAVYLRATSAWTMTTMLQTLMRELDLVASSRRQAMMDSAVALLNAERRPIIVDEADYLLRGRGDMIDALRDIYDLTGCPVVFVGMDEFRKKLAGLGGGRFLRRLTQWVEFVGLKEADTVKVFHEMCDVEVSDDLIAHVHQKTDANIGRIVIALSRIEAAARTSGLERIDLKQFGASTPLWIADVQTGAQRRAA